MLILHFSIMQYSIYMSICHLENVDINTGLLLRCLFRKLASIHDQTFFPKQFTAISC